MIVEVCLLVKSADCLSSFPDLQSRDFVVVGSMR